MRAWKYLRIAALALVLGGLVAAALWPQRIEVDTAPVVSGPMEVTIDEEGETRVRERFTVSAPVSGRLLRIDLEPGDAVVAGKTVVARLAPAAAALLDVILREAEEPISMGEEALEIGLGILIGRKADLEETRRRRHPGEIALRPA